MKIHLYGIFWNEERMFPFFLHHYLPLCERIVLFDNGSTDNTKLLAQEHEKVEIRPWNPDCGHICDAAARHLSQVWRESIGVADWVIIADVDEFLYHQDLLGYLEQLDDIVDVVPLMGYDMINLVYPPYTGESLTTLVRRGVRSPSYDKLSLFKPHRMKELLYSWGRHTARHSPLTAPKVSDVKLLHYRFLGCEDTFLRYQSLNPKMRDGDRKNGCGAQYNDSREVFTEKFQDILAKSVNVI